MFIQQDVGFTNPIHRLVSFLKQIWHSFLDNHRPRPFGCWKLSFCDWSNLFQNRHLSLEGHLSFCKPGDVLRKETKPPHLFGSWFNGRFDFQNKISNETSLCGFVSSRPHEMKTEMSGTFHFFPCHRLDGLAAHLPFVLCLPHCLRSDAERTLMCQLF